MNTKDYKVGHVFAHKELDGYFLLALDESKMRAGLIWLSKEYMGMSPTVFVTNPGRLSEAEFREMVASDVYEFEGWVDLGEFYEVFGV